MLSKQELDAALAAERAMYRALSEVQDITRELLDAVDRQDQVSVRLFLSMRQEQINQLRDQKELLKKQCGGLPKEEGDLLRQILSCPGKNRREWRERPCPSRWNGTARC